MSKRPSSDIQGKSINSRQSASNSNDIVKMSDNKNSLSNMNPGKSFWSTDDVDIPQVNNVNIPIPNDGNMNLPSNNNNQYSVPDKYSPNKVAITIINIGTVIATTNNVDCL